MDGNISLGSRSAIHTDKEHCQEAFEIMFEIIVIVDAVGSGVNAQRCPRSRDGVFPSRTDTVHSVLLFQQNLNTPHLSEGSSALSC